MIKLFLFSLALILALSAPASDKMDIVPVRLSSFRDTLAPTTPASTLAISMSRTLTDLFTTSSLSLSTVPTILTPSRCGSTGDPAAAHFLVSTS
jgi:hypothetical protein